MGRIVKSVTMVISFGDAEYGGTIDKSRGCRKRNTRKDDFCFEYVMCLLSTLQYAPYLISLKHLE